MKQELKKHLLPLAVIFVFISLVWIFNQVTYENYIFLCLGLILGAFLLDIDHLIFWIYVKPSLEESRLAQAIIKKKDYKSLLNLVLTTQDSHNNLIFHHFFFQSVLALISFFVFTSSGSIFTMALVLALNTHILVDELTDYFHDQSHLQDWLFAREKKQLPIKYLRHYLIIFIILLFTFIFLLLNSKT